jgi:non-specific serine/threonine protein kinase
MTAGEHGNLDETRSFKVLSPGTVVSHYRIIEKIGEGGMGVVYKGTDTKLGRTVALKFLPPRLLCDTEARERFEHEAKAASALNHPNITTIYEIDDDEGRCFISMEYLEGRSLKTVIKGGVLSFDTILDVALQVAGGLDAAHKKGVVHRDVKSDNIFATDDGPTKILDFGLAKLKGVPGLTSTGTTIGTLQYMSPEQVKGVEVDHRSDLFSFGIVLYEMVTGSLPFTGEAEASVMYAILNVTPEPLGRYRAEVPEGLQNIVDKALRKDVETRYQSAAEIKADLRSVSSAGDSGIVTSRAITGSSDRSIAVLPFRNMSPDPENEWFSDGMTEDIIAHISKVADLKVISRTSVMRYKNTEKSIPEIGRELGVGAILEGSVRRAGNRLRIVSQLIDTRTDGHIWAETYDRELEDVFEVQSDVARKIADALSAELSPQEMQNIDKKPTGDLTAYDCYLKGRDYYYQYTKPANENAIELFKKALELDDCYAQAYAGLCDAYAHRSSYGLSHSWLDTGIEMGLKALSLDSECVEAHRALGFAYIGKGWLGKAREAAQRALELNPNHAPACGIMGGVCVYLGEYVEALKWMKKSLALDPSHPDCYSDVGWVYLGLEDFLQAELWIGKALELQKDLHWANSVLVWTYLAQGKFDEARAHAQRALSTVSSTSITRVNAGETEFFAGRSDQAKIEFERALEGRVEEAHPWFGSRLLIHLAGVYLNLNEEAKATEMLARAEKVVKKRLEDGDETGLAREYMARICALRGHGEDMYTWLRQAIDTGWRTYFLAVANPVYREFVKDARFVRMTDEVKADITRMRHRAEQEDAKGAI